MISLKKEIPFSIVRFMTNKIPKGMHMQTIQLHGFAKRVKSNVAAEYSKEVYDRYDKLEKWKQLQVEGCFEQTIYDVLQVSRSTIFRWKKSYEMSGLDGLQNASRRPDKIRFAIKQKEIESTVLAIRRKYPIFGKDKIKILMQEEYGVYASVSTIGFVLTRLKKQGKIVSVADICGTKTPYPKRKFEDHAQRYDFSKPKNPGEMVQMDHMSIAKHKHFAAICPITKLFYSQIYTQATSEIGAQFLQELVLFYPFKIHSIQVDGGGEFMAGFEHLCKKMGIKLYVLPPRSPKLNGVVERSNCTARYEFYALNQYFAGLDDMKAKLVKFVAFYNEKRPHQRLNYMTPMRYFKQLKLSEKTT